MLISNEKVAIFSYTLFEGSTEGKVIETVPESNPMEVVFGQSKLIPFFEKNLMGKEKGDQFSIVVPTADAFGHTNPDAVHELSKEVFRVDGNINEDLFIIGNKLPMRDRTGRVLDGYVKNVTEDKITVDFNHPLAGIDIVFEGVIMDVREATYDELNPPQQSCGSGCGSAKDGGTCSTDSEDCGCDSKGSGSCSSDKHEHDHSHGESCGCGGH